MTARPAGSSGHARATGMDALWYCEADGALAPCDPELSSALEDAFGAYWASDMAPTNAVPLGPHGLVDFRTMALLPRTGGLQQPLFRQELPTAGTAVGCTTIPQPATSAVEWGHGQNKEKGRAFAPYSVEISTLLEDAFQQYTVGHKLKGVMFTSTNDANYLVDFERMTQLRLDTNNVRPVYRHSVSLCVRGSGGAPRAGLSKVPSGLSEISTRSCVTTESALSAVMAVPHEAGAAANEQTARPFPGSVDRSRFERALRPSKGAPPGGDHWEGAPASGSARDAARAKARPLDDTVSGVPRPLAQTRAPNPSPRATPQRQLELEETGGAASSSAGPTLEQRHVARSERPADSCSVTASKRSTTPGSAAVAAARGAQAAGAGPLLRRETTCCSGVGKLIAAFGLSLYSIRAKQGAVG